MALTKITPQMFDTSAAGHDFNIDNGTFVVDASANRVGIGSTTPGFKLDVDFTLSTNDGIRILNRATNSSANSMLRLGNDESANAAFLVLNSSAFSGVGGAYNLVLGHGLSRDIVFSTAGTEKVRIDASGNVGIGTSSPRSVSNYGVLAVNGSSGSIIDFEAGEALKTTLTHSSSQFEINVVPALPLVFKTNNSTALTLDSSQNATFAQNLTVSGTQTTGPIQVTAQNAAGGVEGGQIDLFGATGDTNVNLDNYNGSFRVFDGNSLVRLSLDTNGNAVFAGSVYLGDSEKAIFGAGSDLQIFHDGNNSFINNTSGNAGALSIKSHDINLMSSSSETMASFVEDGAVTLYFNNVSKFATQSYGANLSGVLLVNDGTNSAPALSFSNDTDTGIIRVTTNALGITAAGSRKFYVNATNAYYQNLSMVQIDAGNFLLNDSGATERSIRIQNSQATAYFGVEGSSGNRFVGSAVNNMFLGTTTADGIEFATNNNVRAIIDASGNLMIGTNTNLTEKLEVYGSINTTYQSNNFATGAQRGFIDMIGSSKIVRIGSTPGAATASGDQGAIDMTVNQTTRTRFDVNGNVAIGSHGNAPATIHTTNAAITASQSLTEGWTATSGESGTYSTRGSLEVAGVYNKHIMKFAFSGNLAANTWYPFVKRSELTSAARVFGSGSEDGFAMYFRIYSYTSSAGYGEYGSNRLSNMIWINNFGSNSVQEHYFNMGPGFGHAPNGGDSSYGDAGVFRLRVQHRLSSSSSEPYYTSNQTIEFLSTVALSGLDATVAAKTLAIFGYVL